MLDAVRVLTAFYTLRANIRQPTGVKPRLICSSPTAMIQSNQSVAFTVPKSVHQTPPSTTEDLIR